MTAPGPRSGDGVAARRLAIDLVARIDGDGAYANLVTNGALDRSELDDRDRGFVTELVYGTTRMRRACDHLVDRHRKGSVSGRVRAALRVGAYQLAFADVPAHAAVSTTVAAVPKRVRGLVNAVLRRVADDVAAGIEWPDQATERSYPDWIVAALTERLGPAAADALAAMNEPAPVHVRDDGYVQDVASQAVVDFVEAGPGMRVLDVCAAPGGKATGLAATGAAVVAADVSTSRVGLIAANAARLGASCRPVLADATQSPWAASTFDTVLVDAPCSGLGVLRRRPDARWRIQEDAPQRLAEVQRRMLDEAARVARTDGIIVFSVCTLTIEENQGVTRSWHQPGWHLTDEVTIVPDATTDGMYLARFRAA